MKTMINIKADKEVKERAQRIAEELGLPLSTVINAYLKEFIRNREVKFSIEPQLNPEIERLLKQASKDYKQGKNISPAFSDPDKMLSYLRSK